jgi:hypothetical protein
MCFCQSIFLLSLDICSSFSYPHGQDNYLSCCSITDISYLYLFTLDISSFALEYIFPLFSIHFTQMYLLCCLFRASGHPVICLTSLTCLSFICSLIRIKLISPEEKNNAYELRTTENYRIAEPTANVHCILVGHPICEIVLL